MVMSSDFAPDSPVVESTVASMDLKMVKRWNMPWLVRIQERELHPPQVSRVDAVSTFCPMNIPLYPVIYPYPGHDGLGCSE